MRRIAIGCQGGGSHTAFTAGALSAIIADQLKHGDFDIVALSGTSGGAIGALLAWYGILEDGGSGAIDRLDRFWREGFPQGGAARLIPDRLANAAYVTSLRMPVNAGISPYAAGRIIDALPSLAREPLRPWLDAHAGLRTILEEFVDFSRIPELVEKDGRRHELFIGAVEVLSGNFVAFRGTDPAFSVDAVIASGTLPEISRATVIEGGRYVGVYWDGLYSQNPPVRELFGAGDGEDSPVKADEAWLIRINPRTRSTEPQSPRDIFDRRNELAGNLSLEQELEHARFINALVAAYRQTCDALAAAGETTALQQVRVSPLANQINRCRPVVLPEPIAMSESIAEGLDYASKFNRDPEFLNMLIEHGAAQAKRFLARWREAREG